MATQIDEDLRSRDIAAVGREAVQRMAETKILVSGMTGLGCEIAKNVMLAGVKSVTLHDTEKLELGDLSSQFYCSEGDVGGNRAEACKEKLSRLNPSVIVTAITQPLKPEDLAQFTVVVLVNSDEQHAVACDAFCRAQSPPIKFISTSTHGVFASCFCDFGVGHTVTDANGENPHGAIVTFISNDKEATIQCSQDEGVVEFGEGEFVTFHNVEGMEALNDLPPVKVVSTSTYCFKVELDTSDTAKWGKYSRTNLGSYATCAEAKIPLTLDFRSLEECVKDPGEMLLYDFDKFGRAELLHLTFRAVEAFKQANGKAPKWTEDKDAVLKLCKEVNATLKTPLEEEAIDEKVVGWVVANWGACLMPMCSILGGCIGQEVMKAVSNKLTPLNQYFYFDAVECLPKDYLENHAGPQFQPKGCRYDNQIRIFGQDFQQKLESLNYFVVGSGALGCEMLKNFAMMGVACGDGKVTVTDDDIIEKSNLSRQFLFRNHHIGKSKSEVAKDSVKEMNSTFNITALQERVQPASENIFNSEFWTALDGVANALDNVKARRYVDTRCVFFRKPLFESGTMGTKCNVQVVIPDKSTNYGSRSDPETKEAPECALHNFPHNINHCLSLGRSTFIECFTDAPNDAIKYLGTENYAKVASEKIWDENGEMRRGGRSDGLAAAKEEMEVLNRVVDVLDANRPTTFQACVAWSRLQFEDFFVNRIRQLTYTFPEDAKNSSGGPFWSPPKRFPTPLAFNDADPMHMQLIVAGASLKALEFGIPMPENHRDPVAIAELLKNVVIPSFTPSDSVKIDSGEKKGEGASAPEPESEATESDADGVKKLLERLTALPAEQVKGMQVSATEFEKDDDTNHHMDFISAFANLRARNYNIEEVDKLQAKLIAGRIIPALASTTATVTGFVCLELLKYVMSPDSTFRDLQANLALPQFMQLDPETPALFKTRVEKTKPDPVNHPDYEEETEIETIPAEGYTAWDRMDVNKGAGKDMTCQEFIDYWKEKHNVEVTSITVAIEGDKAVSFYNPMFPNTKDNLPKPMSEVYKKHGGLEIAEGDKGYFVVEALFENADGVDVETPTVVYYYR